MPGQVELIPSVIEFGTMNPRECRGEETEVKMVFNRQLIAAFGSRSR